MQGEDTFKGDGTLEDRLRSFAFWLDQLFRPSRTLCKQCKSLHILYAEEEVAGKVDLTLAQYCLTCHQKLHEDPEHKLRSGIDVDCRACHLPLKDNLGRPSIHDHKYVIDGLVKGPSSSSRRGRDSGLVSNANGVIEPLAGDHAQGVTSLQKARRDLLRGCQTRKMTHFEGDG